MTGRGAATVASATSNASRIGVVTCTRPGDPVEVASRRGRIRLKARVDDGVAPGNVFIPFAYAEAAANLLTNPVLDPFGKIPEFKFCAVRVAPADSLQ